MLYPPPLLHSFFWLRGLTLESAIYRWCSFVVVACLGCLWAWRRMIPAHRRDSADWVPVAFGLLLLFQFPMVFELERGNTDICPILGWTAAAFFICRNRLKLAGLAAGLAAAYKLYPAIPCAAVVLGMFWASFGANRFRKANFLRFGVPAILSFAAAQAMFYREAIWYFSRVFPDFAHERSDDPSFSHSIPATCGIHDTFSSLVCLALFGTWTWACRRGLRQQPALTMAGLLAMSTYFGGIANDYALITTYPLLMLLLIRARTTGRYGLLALGLIAIVGDHTISQPGRHAQKTCRTSLLRKAVRPSRRDHTPVLRIFRNQWGGFHRSNPLCLRFRNPRQLAHHPACPRQRTSLPHHSDWIEPVFEVPE